MSRTCIAVICILVLGTVSAFGAPRIRRSTPLAADNPITVRALGERVEKLWTEQIQPNLDSGKHPPGVNTSTINIIWMNGRYLTKSFEVTRQDVLDAKSGFSRGVMYLVRHSDSQFIGLVKVNDQWRSFALTLIGDVLSGDTGKPATPVRLQSLLATFITDPDKVGVYFAPWFRKVSLPDVQLGER